MKALVGLHILEPPVELVEVSANDEYPSLVIDIGRDRRGKPRGIARGGSTRPRQPIRDTQP
jgi:hypothetical protein